MIDLINRRFVAYYFNRSGNGLGGNAAASRFTTGKTRNPYAYLAAFTPDGTYLDESEIYADKYGLQRWLLGLLEKHPELSAWTEAERAVERAGQSEEAKPADRLALARLYEELGRRDDALEILEALDSAEGLTALEAERVRAWWRLLRSAQQWGSLEEALEKASRDKEVEAALRGDRLAERAYLLLARKAYGAARDLLRKEIHAYEQHARASDLHFALGKACWFLEERDWARFHWMWIWHERREERLAMRAKIAAAAQVMPYPNPELGGYHAEGSIGPQDIEQEHRASCALYETWKPYYKKSEWAGPQAAAADGSAAAGSPRALVLAKRLRDGNEHRITNNEIVDRLVELGTPSIEALMTVLRDRSFPGRGYAAWALAQVLKPMAERPAAAIALLREIAATTTGYVQGLTQSGLSVLDGR